MYKNKNAHKIIKTNPSQHCILNAVLVNPEKYDAFDPKETVRIPE
jgi:hypothetical protein